MTLKKFAGFAMLAAMVSVGLLGGPASAAAPKKIVIYGGSGNIGRRIVAEALSRGHFVTVVDRHPKPAAEPNPRLKVVQGNVLDSAVVARQIAGQDVVVSAVSDGIGAPTQGADFYLKVAQSLVGAQRAQQGRAPRLIVSGGASSLRDTNGKLLLDNLPLSDEDKRGLLGHKASLDYLRTVTDVSWTYFSPAQKIANGTRTGVFRVGGDEVIRDAKGESNISTEDFAVAMINEIEKPEHIRQRFTVGY